MLHLDTLGDDPDIDTLVANDPEFHQPDRGRQRESRAVFTDRRIVGPHPARAGIARVDSGGRRHPDIGEHRAIATASVTVSRRSPRVGHSSHRRSGDLVTPLTRRSGFADGPGLGGPDRVPDNPSLTPDRALAPWSSQRRWLTFGARTRQVHQPECHCRAGISVEPLAGALIPARDRVGKRDLGGVLRDRGVHTCDAATA